VTPPVYPETQMVPLRLVHSTDSCDEHGRQSWYVDGRGFGRSNVCRREERARLNHFDRTPGPHAPYRTPTGRWVIRDQHSDSVVSYPMLIARTLSPDVATCVRCGSSHPWDTRRMPYQATVAGDQPSFEPGAILVACHYCAAQVRHDLRKQ
jgi:hypothetical protein